MKQEDKQLSLADLCARFHYGVKVIRYIERNNKIEQLIPVLDLNLKLLELYISNQEFIIKPYLRPMSSMTEEELKEFKFILNYNGTCDCFLIALKVGKIIDANFALLVDWLNKKMFDYRDLIPKGLAIEAPEGMYKKEK